MSPCRVNVGTRSPLSIPVTVVGDPLAGWTGSPNPIQLMNDNDEIVWNLDAVLQAFPAAVDVKLRFDGGQPGYDDSLGPFANISDIVFASSKLTAKNRNHYYGDCYSYYFVVLLSGGMTVDVKPAVRRIDNVAPPCGKNYISPPLSKTVMVDVTQPPRSSMWQVSVNPIKLENDADLVMWNLGELVQSLETSFRQVKDVSLRHFHGPMGFTDKGPFKNISYDQNTKYLTAKDRNGLHGDCYLYYLEVHFTLGNSVQIHFIDPQIDSLAPPDPPLPLDKVPKGSARGEGQP